MYMSLHGMYGAPGRVVPTVPAEKYHAKHEMTPFFESISSGVTIWFELAFCVRGGQKGNTA